MKKSIILNNALLFLLCLVFADTKADNSARKTKAPSPITTGKPPAEMSLLYPRIGRWEVTIRTEPSEGLPRGGIDKGMMSIEKGPGGFSIIQNFHSQGASGDLLGQSYSWWDRATKAYKSVWCDNLQGCIEFTTTINGNSWTVELDGEVNAKKVHTTIRASMSGDHNTIQEEFLNSYDGGPAKKETTSIYRRVKPLAHKH